MEPREPRSAGPASIQCFTSPRYFVPLPAGHVFPMDKFPTSARTLLAEGTVAPGRFVDPGIIDDRDLYRVHTRAYVAGIRSGVFDDVTAKKLGLPPSPQLSVRSHCASAGTLAAARTAMAEGISANLASGTHHAFPDSGQGFCVFNDVAIAVRALRHDEPYLHCMVVDLDAHQGNGTHFIFAGDPLTFCYSVHVGRNYPSTKVPGDLDVPLPRWVGPGEYFDRLTATLPEAVERFEPDVVFYIAGVDVHEEDRFGQMRLTTDDLRRRDAYVVDLCRNWDIPTVVLFGGGYHKTPGMTAELHCQTIRVAAARWRAERGVETSAGQTSSSSSPQ